MKYDGFYSDLNVRNLLCSVVSRRVVVERGAYSEPRRTAHVYTYVDRHIRLALPRAIIDLN